ncbi:MAG TPA: hypothetical protein VKG44_00745, partial [Candidatus Baltobacteraceae bacterium]|nr:hypothetical protein [Candidatus Baltobacteraceae bacterium]
MPRPHEDLQRHTATDHRAGGPTIAFPAASWCAIEVAYVVAERAPAGVASYETLIEKARASTPKAHEAAVLRSHNQRRVIALLHLDGHEAFRHLSAAWDDHHVFAERHAVAESRSLALYRLSAALGEPAFDPSSTDAYAFEHILSSVERVRSIGPSLAAVTNFRGASIFGTDDDRASAIVYRFVHAEDIEAFRVAPETQRVLGPIGEPGETFYPVHVVRTF